MKIRYFFLFLIAITGFIYSQTQYPLVTVHDIQFLPDSIIAQGDSPSPLNGDTVRVRGVVMTSPLVNPDTDRRPVMWAGARWVTYIQDENGTAWAGLNILTPDTSVNAQGTFFDLIDTAQVVEFTGVVTEFFTTTELFQLVNPITPVNIINQLPKRPDPIELSVTDFMENGQLKLSAEKYEGMYVIVRNVVSSDRNVGNGTFRINDGLGNFMFMRDQSGYFTNRANHRLVGKTDWDAPQDGTPINFIRGILETRTDGYYINPIYPGDVNITATPPIISNVRRDAATVAPNQAVKITANIVDLDGSVTGAKLFYHVNGGPTNELVLDRDVSDTTLYSATIPGVSGDSSLVDFYLWAQDNNGLFSTNPSDTTRNNYFYLVMNRALKISDVQYSPFGSGFSGYNNYRVQLTGVVTADTSDIPGFGTTALRVYMQDGEGPWSGIQIGTAGTKGADVLNLKQGDNVTLSGTIVENFSVTAIDSLTNITVNSSGNPLPNPVILSTSDIATKSNGTVDAEKWESVLIGYKNVTVTDDNADGGANNFGEMFVSDNSGDTRVELQDGNHSYHNNWDTTFNSNSNYIRVLTGSTFTELDGILFYSFSNYKLVPRKNDDFKGFVTDVEKLNNNVPDTYSLNQNYPNPFNPSTVISYSIPKAGLVKIRVYNILGQLVKELVNEFQSAGNYKVNFDASSLSSGVYLYSINTNGFTNVKKMVLLK